jgi:hypothetical protein
VSRFQPEESVKTGRSEKTWGAGENQVKQDGKKRLDESEEKKKEEPVNLIDFGEDAATPINNLLDLGQGNQPK